MGERERRIGLWPLHPFAGRGGGLASAVRRPGGFCPLANLWLMSFLSSRCAKTRCASLPGLPLGPPGEPARAGDVPEPLGCAERESIQQSQQRAWEKRARILRSSNSCKRHSRKSAPPRCLGKAVTKTGGTFSAHLGGGLPVLWAAMSAGNALSTCSNLLAN